jgi:hypothetical protein
MATRTTALRLNVLRRNMGPRPMFTPASIGGAGEVVDAKPSYSDHSAVFRLPPPLQANRQFCANRPGWSE